MKIETEPIQEAIGTLLHFIGEDEEREGLTNTPKRVAKFYKEWLTPKKIKWTTFEKECEDMVLQTNIPFYRLCEHHLLPFFGTADVAYIPSERQVGLSKLARCVRFYARSLQNQERLGRQVAHEIQAQLKCYSVAVVLRARHLCMEMRGIEVHDTITTTSTLLGLFKEDDKCRSEFMNLIK